MTPAQRKKLERIHVLMTLEAQATEPDAPLTGAEVADLANANVGHTALDGLPPMSRRSAGTKLNAMAREGLVEAVGHTDTATTYRVAPAGTERLRAFREAYGA